MEKQTKSAKTKKMKLEGLTILALIVALCALVAPVAAQPTPFMIYGWVSYENDTACNGSEVNITNLNITKEWSADTNASYNYYQLMLANGTDVNASEILQFNVTSPDGNQLKVFNHTVNETEVNSGGIFDFNISLVLPAAPTITNRYNNKTKNNSAAITINESECVFFNATADQPIDVWSWFLDDVNQSHNVDNFSYCGWTVNGTYYVKVNGTNANGTSNTITWAVTVEDITPPAKVQNLMNSTPTATAVDLCWTTNTEPDLVGYKVYQNGSLLDTTTNIWYNVMGLSASTTYEFNVSAYDDNDLEGGNATVTVITATYAAPAITDWYNNRTENNAPVLTINESECVYFNATADPPIDVWSWFVNGINQSHNFDNFSYCGWTVNGTYYVKVNGTNANGTSNNVTWTVTVNDTTPPAKVTGLKNDTPTANTVNLSWTASTAPDFTKYSVYKDGALLDNTTSTIYYNVTGLNTSTTYYFNVSAWDDNNNEGEWSDGVTITTEAYPAPVITDWYNNKTLNDSTALAINESECVYFNATADQSIDVWSWFVNGTNQTHNFDNFSYCGWTVNGTYSVEVNARNANGTSDTVNWTVTVNDTTPPAKVTGLKNDTPTANTVNLSWTASTAPDFMIYRVYKDGTLLDNTTSTIYYNVTGLNASTTYYFNVSAWDDNNNEGEWSDGVTITTEAYPMPIITDRYNNKTLNDSTALAINESECVYFNATADQSIDVWSWFVNGTNQTHNFDNFSYCGWTVNGTYYVGVNGTNANGTSNNVTWTVTVNDITPPAKVTGLKNDTPTANTVNLSWNASTAPDFTKYSVYKDGALLDNITSTYCNVTGLNAGTTYYFNVSAWDDNNNEGEWSDGVTIITAAYPMPIITDWYNNKTLNDSTALAINESECVFFNATADQSIDVWSWFVNGTNQSHNFDNFSYCGWTVNGTYYVEVNGTNANGTSDTINWTVTVEDITAPAKVQNLTNSTPTATTVDLWWDTNTEPDRVGYHVYKNGALLNTTTNTWYNVTGLSPSTTYEFNVSAYDDNGLEGENATVIVTTAAYPAPVITNWYNNKTKNNAPALTINESECVYFNATADQAIDVWSWFVNDTNQSHNFDNFSYCDWTVNGTYYVEVNGTNANGTSNSVTWTVTVNDTTPPAKVTGLKNDTPTANTVNLSWTASTAPDFTKYSVYKDGTLLDNTTSTIYYNVTGLNASTTYYFNVSAWDDNNNGGEWSDGVTITTAAYLAPTDVTTYDFSDLTSAGVDKWAYRYQINPNPNNKSDPNIEFVGTDRKGEYTMISKDDHKLQKDSSDSFGNYTAHRFVFNISESADSIVEIDVQWTGKGVTRDRGQDNGATLYIWNGTGYEQLGNTSSRRRETLTGNITVNAGNYIDASRNLTILVVQNANQTETPKGRALVSMLSTDYVRAAIIYLH